MRDSPLSRPQRSGPLSCSRNTSGWWLLLLAASLLAAALLLLWLTKPTDGPAAVMEEPKGRPLMAGAMVGVAARGALRDKK